MAKRETLPKYKVGGPHTPQSVALDYRRYAKYQLRMARDHENFIYRVTHGVPEPRTSMREARKHRLRWEHAPSERRKLTKSNPLVRSYMRKAKTARRLAEQALKAANAAERLIPSPLSKERSQKAYDRWGDERADFDRLVIGPHSYANKASLAKRVREQRRKTLDAAYVAMDAAEEAEEKTRANYLRLWAEKFEKSFGPMGNLPPMSERDRMRRRKVRRARR